MDVSFFEVEGQQCILTVSELTERIKKNLESRFPFVWVKGEISNVSLPKSGHIYFTLKDAESQLECVWFTRRQRKAEQIDPMTGEVFDFPQPAPQELIKNGEEIFCAGFISVYAGRGRYQLIVDLVQPQGAGKLALAFAERKERLAKAGFFDSARKRPMPVNPRRIALITSPNGAAIHDFMELAKNRGLSSQIRLFPVQVQGQDAIGAVCAAIKIANAQNWAEIIVLIRGGGSLEDLWTFNEEQVARAIFDSRLPVLAGIGHEIDFTLADMTADVRAATPSHAAQLLWPLRRNLWQRLDELEIRLQSAGTRRLLGFSSALEQLLKQLNWISPAKKLGRLEDRQRDLTKNLLKAGKFFYHSKNLMLKNNCRLFYSPQFLQAKINLLAEKRNSMLTALLHAFKCLLMDREAYCRTLASIFEQLIDEFLQNKNQRLNLLSTKFETLDPELPLARGYAILAGPYGVITSANECRAFEEISAKLSDGTLDLKVIKISHDKS